MRQTVATWFAKKGKIYSERSILLIIAVLFLLLGSKGFLQGVASAHSGTGKRHAGTVHVMTTVNNQRYGLSGIPVTLSPSSSALDCHSGNSKSTDPNGVATFTDCGVSSNGCAGDPGCSATWTVTVGDTPSGYAITMDKSRQVTLVWNQAKDITFNYSPLQNTQPSQGTPSGGGGGGAPAENRDDPRFHKNGKVQVTTYIRDGAQLVRQGGFKLQTISESYGVDAKGSDGTLLNCNPHDKTTNESHANESLYAQAHFDNCWTGKDDKKSYKLRILQIPAGLTYRSFHIDGGKFTDNTDSTTGIDYNTGILDKSFIPTSGEIKLSIWTDRIVSDDQTVATIPGSSSTPKPGSTGSGGSGSGTGGSSSSNNTAQPPRVAVRQVFTEQGVVFVAVRPGEATQTLAETLTQSFSQSVTTPPCDPELEDCGDDPGLEPDTDPDAPDDPIPAEEKDKTPPPKPTNVRVEAAESGTPEISWDEVKPDTREDNELENIQYKVDRILNGDPNAQTITVANGLEEPKFTDDKEGSQDPAKIPASYTYYVYAVDDAVPVNLSKPSVQEITLVLQTPQVPAATASTPNPPAELQGNNSQQRQIPFTTVDGTTRINIQAGAGGTTALACAIVNRESTAPDTANLQGEAVVTTIGLDCRGDQGEEKEELETEVEYEIEVEDTLVSDDTDVYAYDGTDWEEIDTDETIDEGETLDDEQFEEDTTVGKVKAGRVKGDKTKFKVKSKRILTLAIIDKYNTSPVVKIAVISSTVAALGGIAFMTYVIIMRRRIQARALHPYEDVDIRPLNPRVDYSPTLTAPEERRGDDDTS